jgi:chromosome segregation ATPase
MIQINENQKQWVTSIVNRIEASASYAQLDANDFLDLILADMNKNKDIVADDIPLIVQKLNAASSQVNDLSAIVDALKAENAGLISKNQNAITELEKAHKAEIAELKAQLVETEKQLTSKTAELATLTAANDELKQSFISLKSLSDANQVIDENKKETPKKAAKAPVVESVVEPVIEDTTVEPEIETTTDKKNL